ncbi:PREDICTED: serine/threonine-protein kinase STY17-like [Camelina sativa]|uniref:Serine/threonine-protein kinase STY17-like n=1 Tax=Camelina sativa TaxID=90675 RepID=A0ABM0TTN9_CAMSA|nr:PREDICTED: serine/threonine-protein kinase STY17-like [Camelina sativa]
MAFSNYPSYKKSNKKFNFSISRELLLNPNDVSVGEMIGEGNHSIVYKGLFRNRVPVAVKIMQPSVKSAVSIMDKKKFQNEVLLLSKMRHANIVKFVGACIVPQLAIVTELMEGGTLQRFMWSSQSKPLDLKKALTFALDISRAMEFLHSEGIIHRDLNPANLLLTGDHKHVKLADFGIAREENRDGMTGEAGTCKWMAPEVSSREALRVEEPKHYDHKVDVYSFALVFWELLNGVEPFPDVPNICVPPLVQHGERPSLANTPEEMIPILELCWAQDSDARLEFKDIRQLLTSLLTNLTSDDSIDTLLLSDEEAYDGDIDEDSETPPLSLSQEHCCKVNKPKEKKKKILVKMMRPFVKMFRACYKP